METWYKPVDLYRAAWQMTFGPIYVDLTWETIHLRFLLTVVSLLSIAQYSPETSTGFQPFHVTKVGNFHTEKQQAPGIRVLINRQRFKTGILEIPIRESLFALTPFTLSYTAFPPVLFCMQFLLLLFLHFLHRFIVARVITTILRLSRAPLLPAVN